MSDTERFHLLRTIVSKSKIRVVCPECLHSFPRLDVLYEHCRDNGDEIHRGLALRPLGPEFFLTFRERYEDAVGHEVHPDLLRSDQPVFDPFFVIERKLPEHADDVYTERYRLLRQIVGKSKVRVACPKCLQPGPRPNLLKDKHFKKEEDPDHQGLALRKEGPKAFRESYQNAVGKRIPRDLLGWDKPVFDIYFVIERKVLDHEN